MTRDEILAMKPGHLLDDALAPLLGYEVRHVDMGIACWVKDGLHYEPVPLSTTWEGMRLVVEVMERNNWWATIDKVSDVGDSQWMAIFNHPVRRRRATALTAPHAVALAALLAREGEA